jgi:arabinofuranosyltransferase
VVRVLSLAVLASILLRTAWVCDDAYITLRTIDNFVHGYGLRWNVVERVQTFTHPLWLFLEAIPYFFTREAFYTCAILSIGISLIGFALLVFRIRVRSAGALALGAGMLLCSRSFIDYSTSGLENPLTHLLIVLFLIVFLGDARAGPRRLLLLSGIAGLAALNRIDSLWLLGPPLLVSALGCGRAGALKTMAAGFLPFLLWEIFAVFYYGSPLPNSALAKLSTGIDASTLIRHGLYYLVDSLRNDPVTLTGIAAALVAATLTRGPQRGRRLAVACGILLNLFYVIRIGGDFMSGRFLSAPFLAAVILITQTDPFPGRRVGRGAFALIVVILGVLLTPHPPIASGVGFGSQTAGVLNRHGICDERRYYFKTSGMFNGAPTAERPFGWGPVVVGRDARRNGSPLIVEGAVGVTGYAAGPKTHVLDYHALGDPLLSRLPAVVNDTKYQEWMLRVTNDLDPQGWRIGHFRRQIPKGYLATILIGENRIEDPKIAAFYDRLRLVTQGPFWNRRRLAAAVGMSFGRWNDLLPRARPGFEDPVDWTEILAIDPNLSEPLFQLAQESAEAGEFDEALRRLDDVLRLDPGHVRGLLLMGRIWTGEGDTKRADAYLDRLRITAPELHLGWDWNDLP